MKPTRFLPALLVLLFAAPASAGVTFRVPQDHIELENTKAKVNVQLDEKCHDIVINMSRDDGWKESWKLGSFKAGQVKSFTWDPGPGEYAYEIEALVTYPEGRKDEIYFDFDLVGAHKPKLKIPRDGVDLEAKTIDVILDQPLGKVELTVIDDNLSEIGKSEQYFVNKKAGDRVQVKGEWDGKPFQIVARGYDEWEFRWAEAEANPWSLEIPHEDVIFDTGKWDIKPEEAPKLDRAYAEIDKAIKKYGQWVEAKLYVGGYTDTVGNPGDNQVLSQNRAKAISQYFEDKGFKFNIYYQGFGERALAVPTGDSVDEQANRRAVYALAADTPLRSSNFPSSSWKKLP